MTTGIEAARAEAKPRRVIVSGAFDEPGSPMVRFLQEAARLGELHVALWSDEAVGSLTGCPPKLPAEERRYVVGALRYVQSTAIVEPRAGPDGLPETCGPDASVWVVLEGEDTAERRRSCMAKGISLEVVPRSRLAGFPVEGPRPERSAGGEGRPLVVVTGCYDWLHSGHVRFFEEVAELGELVVVLGSDANVRNLKGEGHPLFGEEERRYMVGSVRHVRQALVATGWGWLDAEPEILRLRPDIYAVNRDGDRPEKRDFCAARGIRYVVLERAPRPGLLRRSSTDLRGY